jgi:hypothetical protein
MIAVIAAAICSAAAESPGSIRAREDDRVSTAMPPTGVSTHIPSDAPGFPEPAAQTSAKRLFALSTPWWTPTSSVSRVDLQDSPSLMSS